MANKDGKGIRGAADYADVVYAEWQRLDKLDRLLQRLDEEDLIIVGIRFRPPNGENTSWLAIITADGAEGSTVAFHDAPTYRECFVGMVNRLENRSLKWKENKPWNGR